MTMDHPKSSVDKYLFSRFEDVASQSYDYLVLGGGCTASALVRRVLRNRPSARVLLLDQNSFLLPDHVQNMPVFYQSLIRSAQRNPWGFDGDLTLVSQVPHFGGRTLIGSGSCPRPSPDLMADWPTEVVDDLAAYWSDAREALRVARVTALAPEFDVLQDCLRKRVLDGLRDLPGLHVPEYEEDLDADLALGPAGQSSDARKFCAVPAILQALQDHPGSLSVVADCEVTGFEYADGALAAIQANAGEIAVGNAKVVLAVGAVEATELVLGSLPPLVVPLAGTGLAGHTASSLVCRVPRSHFPALSDDHADVATLYLDGSTGARQFSGFTCRSEISLTSTMSS